MKFIISYPIKPVHVNQYFGQNLDPVYKAQGLPGHNGMDFMAMHGEEVYAAHDGLASFQIDDHGGHGVVIVSNQAYDYNGSQSYFKTIYWHLCDHKETKFASFLQDKTGFTPVKRGDIIGYADSTGVSTGDHLHFGLKPVAKGENWGMWYNTDQNNGYNGAIDPLPFFDGTCACDTPPLDQAQVIIQNIMTSPATPKEKVGLLQALSEWLARVFS